MTTANYRQIVRKFAAVLFIACLCCLCAPRTDNAQDTAKQKIKCWVKCCPLEIGCQFNSARTASKTEPNADITVNGDELVADFKPTGDQKVYEVKAETKLDASTAEALGFKEITLLPGQYAISPLRNGRAKVSIKVRTVAAKGKKADSTN